MTNRPIKMICAKCGSDDVMHDAWAVWDIENQMWELGPTFDHAHCGECDGETTIKEVPA